jgi:hypothetical protein
MLQFDEILHVSVKNNINVDDLCIKIRDLIDKTYSGETKTSDESLITSADEDLKVKN